jgi:hypothetical protein
MAECQPVRAGFSAAFRRPAICAAEIAWRWAFAAAAWLLIAYGVLLFLKSVPVSDADMFGLSGIIPGRVIPTIIHILAGSGPKMLKLALALLVGVSLLSWLACSVGRTAVLRALLSTVTTDRNAAIFRLNLLRTFCLVLVTLAYAGCAFLIAHSSAPQDQTRPVSGARDFSLLFAALAVVLAWFWGKLDGRLTLATVFVVRGDASVADAIVRSTDVSIRRIRQFAWIGLVFGFFKLVLVVGAFFCAVAVFTMFAALSTTLAVLAVFAVLLMYSALANFSSVGALAAQIRVIEWDETSD